MRRGWKVRIPYPEINYVNPLGPDFFFLAINLLKKIRRELF
jgi:hypothetical protein